MAKKRVLYLVNWEKYQARTDKELPWCKLWGNMFDKPWWQELPDDFKAIPIIFLDVARKFNNKMPSEMAWYVRNYGLKHTENDLLNFCKVLFDNEFLSDVASDIQDKTRVDKIRVDKSPPPSADIFKNPVDNPLKEENPKFVNLRDVVIGDLGEPAKHKLYNSIIPVFQVRGWCIEVDFLKQIFIAVAGRMNGKEVEDVFPYFQKVLNAYVNENADLIAQSSAKRKKELLEKEKLNGLRPKVVFT